MKKFAKVLSLLLAAVLLVAVSVSLTVAYLTDVADDKKNTFAVGDISISLDEEVGVSPDGGATVETKPDGSGAVFENVMPGDSLTKKVTVKNTDTVNPAYVAVVVTLNNAGKINDAIDDFYESLHYTDDQIQAIYDEVFPGWDLVYAKEVNGEHQGMRLTCDRATDATLLHVDSVKSTKMTENNYLYAYDNWFQSQVEKDNTNSASPKYGFIKDHTQGYYYNGIPSAEIDPMGDYQMRYVFFLYLTPGQEYTVFEGLKAPAEFTREQLAMFDKLDIKVEAAAIQAVNTQSPQEAFAALFGYKG